MKAAEFDAIVVGAGLAGLVAAAELADAGKCVALLDQEGEQSIGGQAFWSFGGLFLVNSPEQRRLGIHDSRDLAWQDWLATAGFDREEDAWPRKWAEAYVDFAAGEKRSWLHSQGLRFFPSVGWAERGGSSASGPGIRVLPGPSSLWLNPMGERLPFPYYPGADTLGTLAHITTHRYPYTWFVLNRAIIRKEFALSGSEQNPDLTGKNIWLTLGRLRSQVQAPVQAFMDKGLDFIVKDNLKDLVDAMNAKIGNSLVKFETVEREIKNRDAQLLNVAGKDAQLAIAREARKILSERLVRVVKPSPLLNPADGPLIAVKMNILTRKSLGGLETDLSSRVLSQETRQPIPGLYAAGEVAGFGGGGVHGYRSLEGTFLGGCLFSGRTAGRAAAAAI